MKEIFSKEYYNKVLGSWVGRIAGDHVGYPLEFRPYSYIKLKYGDLDYFPRKVNTDYVNDDEMYEICALIALEKNGINLTSEDIAKEWVRLLYKQYFTAEKVALKNLKMGIKPPESGKVNNVYQDAIGAQMRADIWGQITPGCPELAKDYAMMDGCISHSGIGIEGEIFIASMISLSFFNDNIKNIIDKSLKLIPSKDESLYTLFVEKAITIYNNYPRDYRKARKALIDFWHEIRWSRLIPQESLLSKRNLLYLNRITSGVHVLPNIGIIILSLLYGVRAADQLGESICIAARMGLDTDCNCGNIGAIIGTILGLDNIPKKWKLPLRNKFSTYVKGYEQWKITELAKRISSIGKLVIEKKCQNSIQII
ncbi:MAG: hypothetical protein GF317_22135 [Candidatus Lokiarchaeota archaeon]|nr:hypothetical protein [Candidatus Lokiarchaeota archaeon]MBD3202160.1 hypothetical protein [Candidatus Lokiarchaeota archaeon]